MVLQSGCGDLLPTSNGNLCVKRIFHQTQQKQNKDKGEPILLETNDMSFSLTPRKYHQQLFSSILSSKNRKSAKRHWCFDERELLVRIKQLLDSRAMLMETCSNVLLQGGRSGTADTGHNMACITRFKIVTLSNQLPQRE